ncbi:acyltransferase [Streptomyces sp. OF3]|uniref:Acyltransferase n=1 Tax=Streptomyces alkaliterrae TaxID=2213162 RepID=A0A7W3WKB7_9ACTN|nr:acyltransferase [Streptomyces alkaliterrae]MBB1253952.1 acyltransferase [Streptomyces alkaliterrae]
MTITPPPTTAAELAAATPRDRERFVDLLRVASLGTVVLGHWLMAAVGTGPGGDPEVGNLLAVLPALQPLTWLLQVMPVFFLVGGFSHALSYRSLRRRAGDASPYPAFLRARLQRLLRPTAAFVVVWTAGALLVQSLTSPGPLTAATFRLVTQPLWFVGIYLAMVALTPPLLRAHERWGWGAFGALVGAAVAVDVARFGPGLPYVEFLNFAFVWLAVHQLGFLRADGRLRLPGVPAALAVGGLVSAALLVWLGPYPLSMVGMPGEKVSNMAPPTLALLCHALWLVGAVEALRVPASRLLDRPRVWRLVVAANGVAMTAFLWHLTAMLGVYGGLLALGVGLPEPATAAWWAQLPLRLMAAALLTALLVAAFRRFELPSLQRPFTPPATGGPPLAALGVSAALLGVLGLSMVGLGGLFEGRSAVLVAVPMTAPVAIGLVLAGWLLVERAGRGSAAASRLPATDVDLKVT